MLAPTTVLAFQHFETFKRRFQPFPVRIEMLSRFRSAKEFKPAMADMAEGKVDIAIGTHRLLSKDVEFRDLGPGDRGRGTTVRGKAQGAVETTKDIASTYTMSATPIPRTLHMSMLGLRDMSVIERRPRIAWRFIRWWRRSSRT